MQSDDNTTQKGYRWYQGHWGDPRECRGVGTIRGVGYQGYWGRECRYSGVRRDIGGIRGHWQLLGGVGAIRGIMGCRGYQGCIGGLAGSVGTQGPEGV